MNQPTATFALLQQIDPETPLPFRIIETVETSDGYRSRITNSAHRTMTQATDALTDLRERYKPAPEQV